MYSEMRALRSPHEFPLFFRFPLGAIVGYFIFLKRHLRFLGKKRKKKKKEMVFGYFPLGYLTKKSNAPSSESGGEEGFKSSHPQKGPPSHQNTEQQELSAKLWLLHDWTGFCDRMHVTSLLVPERKWEMLC